MMNGSYSTFIGVCYIQSCDYLVVSVKDMMYIGAKWYINVVIIFSTDL